MHSTFASLPSAGPQKINWGTAAQSRSRLGSRICWPWSDALPSGELVNDDPVVGDLAMPWNAKPESTKLAPGIPKVALLGDRSNGLQQVGCVYTAQGFESSSVGVIFGQDIKSTTQRG